MKPRRPALSLSDLAAEKLIAAVTPDLQEVASQFSVALTPALIDLIDSDNPHDPIAAQFVPSENELRKTPEELNDPIGDARHSPTEGIIHRYPDRVLLKPVHTCAVYCRFCFRREQVGNTSKPLDEETLKNAFDYIRSHPEIWEVILSGGDPLVLSNRRLAHIVSQLNSISHVKVIRLHTRLPVANPARVTSELIRSLKGRCPVYILIHCNHPRELSPAAREACALLADAGFPLLSQSVLLKGINDTTEILTELMRAFVENRIKPHYLHHGDLAYGTSHFRLPLEKAQTLLKALRGNISGLCQPTYMLDIPGGHGKAPAGPVFVESISDKWVVEDYQGERHTYKDSLSDSSSISSTEEK